MNNENHIITCMTDSTLLRCRTLPPEFFQQAKLKSPLTPLSSRAAGSYRGGRTAYSELSEQSSCITTASTNTLRHYWNVVAFVDVRHTTKAGLPTCLLPLPTHSSILRFHLEQLANCRRIIVLTLPHHFKDVQYSIRGVHPGLKVVSGDSDGDPKHLAAHYHSSWGSRMWEEKTVTLWWNANVLFHDPIMWRPYTDHRASLVIRSKVESGMVQGWAWQYDQWNKLNDVFHDTAFHLQHPQQGYDLRTMDAYFHYIQCTSQQRKHQ